MNDSSQAIEEGYQHCLAIARGHYENFPVASLFLPKDKRLAVAAIYTFARVADDIADEPGLSDVERIEQLELHRLQIPLEDPVMQRVQKRLTHHSLSALILKLEDLFDNDEYT